MSRCGVSRVGDCRLGWVVVKNQTEVSENGYMQSNVAS